MTELLLSLGQAEPEGWLTGVLLEFARGGAEWVLWLLVVLSLVSVAVMVERARFYRRHRVDAHDLRLKMVQLLDDKDLPGLNELVADNDSMEAHVLAYGLRNADRGPKAVEELMIGALAKERVRYDRNLSILATLGNNAPFVGLFGTVLGVIQAFDGLQALDMSNPDAGKEVMGPIAEALIATGVGILVAIPAVVAFNIFRSRVKQVISDSELLARTLLAHLMPEAAGSAPAAGGNALADGSSASSRTVEGALFDRVGAAKKKESKRSSGED